MSNKRGKTMKQLGLGQNPSTKKTRKREFQEEMELVVPWGTLVQIVQPHCPKAKTGRPPFAVDTVLRIHYLQQWFGLSDPAMEEALHDVGDKLIPVPCGRWLGSNIPGARFVELPGDDHAPWSGDFSRFSTARPAIMRWDWTFPQFQQLHIHVCL